MIHIRTSVRSDLPDLMRVENESFSAPWSEESMRSFLNHPDRRNCFTATDDEANHAVIGYLVLQYVGNEAEICNIAVCADERGRGIGAMLLDSAIDFCARKSASFLHLEVRRNNIQAIGLYEKKGFRMVGTRKGYYEDTGEDALLYAREITGEDDQLYAREMNGVPTPESRGESECGR